MSERLIDRYPYIYAWGRMMGSRQYYVFDQIMDAIVENAPLDAVYKKDDGTWATFREVTNPSTRKHITDWIDRYNKTRSA